MELTIILSSGARNVIPLAGDRMTIGRKDCDIIIDSIHVSRAHAELVRKSDSWEIRDLKSLNGLEVGGKVVERWRLRDGDRIKIGDATIYVGPAPDDSTIIIKREPASNVLQLDTKYHCLRVGGKQYGKNLADLEYKLLKVLWDENGQPVPRKRIEEAVWGANAYDDNALHQLVRRTREKINDDSSKPLILQTLPGVGYRFNIEAEVEVE